MKKISAIFAALLASATTSTAAQPALEKLNPNAVAKVLMDRTAQAAGQGIATFIKADNFGLLCAGKIDQTPIVIMGREGNVRYDSILPEIVKFAYNPNARDKETQAKVRTILESRNDLAYLEFTSVLAPDGKAISAYLEKTYGKPAIDAYTAGTSMRDGSKETGILVDQAILEKFAADNKDAIVAAENSFKRMPFYVPDFYSHCGPQLRK